MTATLRDVAARAGVSVNTVSRALNNSGYVSRSARDRVTAAAEELQYVPNAVASSLRSQRTQSLALLLTDITNPFWTTVARGVEDTAIAAGYGVMLCNTDEDPAKEARYLDLLTRRRIDGLVVGPTSESTELLQSLLRRGVPFVIVDRWVEGVAADSVRGDSHGGAYAATRHLLQTGFRRIALIGGPATVSTADEREAGYRAALAGAGVPVDPALICRGSYRQTGGYDATRALLAAAHPPDAIFAGNSLIALGALEAVRSLGRRVPEDVALISFDDFPYAAVALPFLTAVVQPAAEIGRQAARMLLERLADPAAPPRALILPTELVVRRSCGCGAGAPFGGGVA
jgi:LacI family transcriptional regulator